MCWYITDSDGKVYGFVFIGGYFSYKCVFTTNAKHSITKEKEIQKNSSIIFISSISGVFRSQIGEGGYGASKAALIGYVKSLALELSALGIRVNTIHPGIVETPILEVSNDTFGEEELESLLQKYPLKRFGKPEDIAHCAVYLLSDASSWMTGSNILIDGGYTLK